MRYFKTIAGQVILLTLGAVLLSEFMVVGIHVLTRKRVDVVMERYDQEIYQITKIYRVLQNSPREDRDTLLRLSSNSDIRFSVTEKNMGQIDVSNDEEFSALKNRLEVESVYKTEEAISWDTAWHFWFSGPSIRCYMPDPGENISPGCPYSSISVPLKEGEWFSFEKLPESKHLIMMLPVFIATIIFSSVILLVVFFMVNRITSPLKSLANAAKKLGRGEQIELLEPNGPSEIATTIEAFNVMQERLTRFVEGRTQLLASISHDLRTPITSLRLRAEFIDDEELRKKIVATLVEMQTMVAACLRFSSQDAHQEDNVTVNIVGILEDLASEVPQIRLLTERFSCSITCRPMSLRRAIRNILDNAVHYGERADIGLTLSKKQAIISVQDQGPGVPEDRLGEIFEPFIRLGKERNTESGNVGLGLSISKSIIQNHGGTIRAENTEQGLRVIIIIPAA